MAVSLFPQSYLTSDQVLAIVGEGQRTEGSPETQKSVCDKVANPNPNPS